MPTNKTNTKLLQKKDIAKEKRKKVVSSVNIYCLDAHNVAFTYADGGRDAYCGGLVVRYCETSASLLVEYAATSVVKAIDGDRLAFFHAT